MPADWAFAIIYVMVFGFAVYIGFLLGDGHGHGEGHECRCGGHHEE